VHNFGVLPPKECSVFVNRILWNGQVIESQRSPLNWTDKDVFTPQTIARGFSRGLYADVCAADQIIPALQVKSEKASKGYGLYGQGGIYKFEISAEGSGVTSNGFISLEVEHDGRQWDGLRTVSARPKGKWFRWW